MHKYLQDYPPAPGSRAIDAEKRFPYQTLSPDEYAAREGHRWHCFSFGEYVYANEALNEWIHTLDDIFFTPGRLQAVREKYLTAEEIKSIEEESQSF